MNISNKIFPFCTHINYIRICIINQIFNYNIGKSKRYAMIEIIICQNEINAMIFINYNEKLLSNSNETYNNFSNNYNYIYIFKSIILKEF